MSWSLLSTYLGLGQTPLIRFIDATISWKLPGLPAPAKYFCLPLAHALECDWPHAICIFCEEASWVLCYLQPDSGATSIWHWYSVPLPVLALRFPPVLHWFSWSDLVSLWRIILGRQWLYQCPHWLSFWSLQRGIAGCMFSFSFEHSGHVASSLDVSKSFLTAPPVLECVLEDGRK